MRGVDTPAIAIITTSALSALGLTIRSLFQFLDHRDERRLLLELLDKTGTADDFTRYTELRRHNRPAIHPGRTSTSSTTPPQHRAARLPHAAPGRSPAPRPAMPQPPPHPASPATRPRPHPRRCPLQPQRRRFPRQRPPITRLHQPDHTRRRQQRG